MKEEGDTPRSRALRDLFGPRLSPISVNDGGSTHVPAYLNALDLGDTPKERVINALCLIDNGLWEEACGVYEH